MSTATATRIPALTSFCAVVERPVRPRRGQLKVRLLSVHADRTEAEKIAQAINHDGLTTVVYGVEDVTLYVVRLAGSRDRYRNRKPAGIGGPKVLIVHTAEAARLVAASYATGGVETVIELLTPEVAATHAGMEIEQ